MRRWSFSSKSSMHHNSQTVRARELKFWENVHPTPCVMCHVSCVMCHVSCVTCHVSHVTCHLSSVTCHMSNKNLQIFNFFVSFFFCLKKKLLSGGARRWRVCYQRGLPRLVFLKITHYFVYIILFSVAITSIKSSDTACDLLTGSSLYSLASWWPLVSFVAVRPAILGGNFHWSLPYLRS